MEKYLLKNYIKFIRFGRRVGWFVEPVRTYKYKNITLPFYKAPIHSKSNGDLYVDEIENELCEYKQGEVILLKSDENSLISNTGLFVVFEEKNDELILVKINKNGNLEKFSNGKYMFTYTRIDNELISKTKLFFMLNDVD